MAKKNKKMGRRTIALLLMMGIAIVIGVLIAYEQISVLYVLATLAIVLLLLVVGFADLEAVSRTDSDSSHTV
jgi:Kef-type K+ transport system membrane component KefB